MSYLKEMSIYDFNVAQIDGKETSLQEYKGKVVLIVNVASQCGLTPQYSGLEELYEKYKAKGLVILGFPCNQFGGQEPGTEAEIKTFCETSFQVTFPLFSKINVNGADTHPLYKYLKIEKKGFLGTEAIKWNFTKFLIDREGKVVERFSPQTEPAKIADDIEKYLDLMQK
jgi:glutathione peroxidase